MKKLVGLLLFSTLMFLPSAEATASTPQYGLITIENGSYLIEQSTTIYADELGALRFRGDCTLTIAPDAVLTILGAVDSVALCGIVLEAECSLLLNGSIIFQQVPLPFYYENGATLTFESANVYFTTDSPPNL